MRNLIRPVDLLLAAAMAAALVAPAPAQEDKKFRLEVDANDLGLISQALNELPKRVADPLIARLNAQLAPQSPKPEDKVEPAKKGDREQLKK